LAPLFGWLCSHSRRRRLREQPRDREVPGARRPSDNIVNHHGRRTLFWSMKVKNGGGFDAKGRVAYINGASSAEIVFSGNTVSYSSCSDDCKGAASVTPICGLAPNG
jgi:hypothetical protein